MGADQDVRLLQDRVLADRARQGARAALDELYRRHAPSSWRLAHAVAGRSDVAETAVAHAFATTLAVGPVAIGPARDRTRVVLLAATRRAAIDAGRGAPKQLSAALAGVDAEAIRARAAFDALPERWRSVLWLVDVEGCRPEDATRVVGLERGEQGSLLERARVGLSGEILNAVAGAATAPVCRRTIGRLSDYASGHLPERDEKRVRTHLDDCAACRQRLAGLDDLVPALRSTAAALPAALAGRAAEQWSASLVRKTGPLHVALPGGEPMPVWAQRALAGTAAAIIALGVTGATLLNGRGGRSRPDAVRPVSGDGESAIASQDLPPFVLDGSGFPTLSLGAANGAAPSALPAEIARSAGALSRSTAPATSGDAPPVGGPTGPGAGAPPTAPEQPSPPPPSESGVQATAGVDGVASATVGDSCVGAQALDQSIGCSPPATDEPVSVETGTASLGL